MRALLIALSFFILMNPLARAHDSEKLLLELNDLELVESHLEALSREERDMFFKTALPSGEVPLLYATRTGDLALFSVLAAAGADPNVRDANDRDILNIAIRQSNPALAALAIKHGTDPKAFTTRFRGSTLIFASDRGEVEIVEMLIEAGAPLDRRNSLGWTALLEATVLGDGGSAHLEVVRLLLEAGADQSITDNDGLTPLAHAKRRGHTAMVELLSSYL